MDEGEVLVAEDCGSDNALFFVYREEGIITLDLNDARNRGLRKMQAFSSILCLEADEEDVKLEECDTSRSVQNWYFVKNDYEGVDYFRMKNGYYGRYIQLVDDDDEVALESSDKGNEKQLLEQPAEGFFPSFSVLSVCAAEDA